MTPPDPTTPTPATTASRGAFAAALAARSPVDEAARAAAVDHHGRLTKPAGSLGRLEAIGAQLAAIAGVNPPPLPSPAAVAVFAGDHGVLAQGVSPWPQEVTAQMVANFCAGGAAVNALARTVGVGVVVVDVGVATPLIEIPGIAEAITAGTVGDPATPVLLRRRVADGTADLSAGPALSAEQVDAALDVGASVAAELVAAGARALLTGDMGIGNTTPSAALIAASVGRAAAEVTGRGTGVDDATLAHKTELVASAVARLPLDLAVSDPKAVLAEVGGLEHAALVGFIVGGAAAGVPVIVDGVIALSALLIAEALAPGVTASVVAGHRSVEPGASVALDHLGLVPLIDLDLRLGEGTGACLALPLVQAAARVLQDMATFDSAGVTEK